MCKQNRNVMSLHILELRCIRRLWFKGILIGCSSFEALRLYGSSLRTDMPCNMVHSIYVLPWKIPKWNISFSLMLKSLELIYISGSGWEIWNEYTKFSKIVLADFRACGCLLCATKMGVVGWGRVIHTLNSMLFWRCLGSKKFTNVY